MSTHPSPDKYKDKEEYYEYALTFLINLAKFYIGRVKEVGILGVGK